MDTNNNNGALENIDLYPADSIPNSLNHTIEITLPGPSEASEIFRFTVVGNEVFANEIERWLKSMPELYPALGFNVIINRRTTQILSGSGTTVGDAKSKICILYYAYISGMYHYLFNEYVNQCIEIVPLQFRTWNIYMQIISLWEPPRPQSSASLG
jgi:hypothetical protein